MDAQTKPGGGSAKLRRSYSGELLRQGDPDRYLLSLFAGTETREDLWALFAFNLELARTQEVTADHTLGLIRLQWWRETVDAICAGHDAEAIGGVPADLAKAARRHALTPGPLNTMIEARERTLGDQPFDGPESLRAFVDASAVPLMRLAGQIDGRAEAVSVIEAVARAHGISGILRAVPLTSSSGASPGPNAQGREDLRRQLGALAEEATAWLSVKPRTRLFKAQKALAAVNLGHIVSCNCDPADARLTRPPPLRELRVWWRVLRSSCS